MSVYAIVFTGEGVEIASTLEELARAVERARGRAYVILVEGRVIGSADIIGTERSPAPVIGEAGAHRSERGEGGKGRASKPVRVAAVFDQMFRGFADIVAREVPEVELHEVVGRGLERTLRVGRIFKEPARDDYDVLSLVERLASEGKKVVFFTGDKKLANQAMALDNDLIVVKYMPPNEYPGKESLARAMIRYVREQIGTSD